MIGAEIYSVIGIWLIPHDRIDYLYIWCNSQATNTKWWSDHKRFKRFDLLEWSWRYAT